MILLFDNSVQIRTFRFSDTVLHKQLILRHLTVQLNSPVLCLSQRLWICIYLTCHLRGVLLLKRFLHISPRRFTCVGYATRSRHVGLQFSSCWQPWYELVSSWIARHSQPVTFGVYILSRKFCVCYKYHGVLMWHWVWDIVHFRMNRCNYHLAHGVRLSGLK